MTVPAETPLEDAWRLCCAGDPRAALSMALEVLNNGRLADQIDLVAEAACRIAWFSFQLGDIELGIEHAIEARQLFRRLQNKSGECWASALYAWLLHEAGLIELSSHYANDAVLTAETLDDQIIASWAFNVLAVIFWTSKQVDRALPWSERAVATLRRVDQPCLLGWWLINLGGIHAEAGYLHAAENDTAAQTASINIALEITAEATALAELEDDLWGLALTLCNRVEYHLAINQREDAEILLARATALPEIGPRTTAHYLYTNAQYLSYHERNQEALLVSEHALAFARTMHNIDYESHALRYLSGIHENLREFERALHFFKEFYKVQSKLEAQKVRMCTRVTEAHYQTEHFKALADQASQRAEVLAAMSFIDPLTGVGNRRALDQILADLRRSSISYGLAIVDLDHFKLINDTFSHAVGDEVLRRVGAILRTSLRQTDSAFRMGGEEFVLVFVGVNYDTLLSICTRLLAFMREAPWSEVHGMLRVTASIGIGLGVEASDPSEVLALVDERLYAAKHGGRDRVVGGVDEPAETAG